MRAGEKLKLRREKANLTGQELAAKLGIKAKSYVSNLENGYAPIGAKMRVRLSEIFKCSPSEFADDAVSRQVPSAAGEHALVDHEVPNLGTLSASRFSFSFDMPVDNLLPFTIRGRAQERYAAFTVSGDCMEPTIKDGDEVVVRQTQHVEDGTIAVVYHDGECTLKRVYRKKDGVLLKPDNAKYPGKLIASNKVEIRAEVWRIMTNPRRKP